MIDEINELLKGEWFVTIPYSDTELVTGYDSQYVANGGYGTYSLITLPYTSTTQTIGYKTVLKPSAIIGGIGFLFAVITILLIIRRIVQ